MGLFRCYFSFCIFYPPVGKGLASTYASTGGGRWHPQGDGGSVLILHLRSAHPRRGRRPHENPKNTTPCVDSIPAAQNSIQHSVLIKIPHFSRSLHLLRGGVNAVDGRVIHSAFCFFYPLVGKGLAPTYASTGGGRWHPQGDGGSVLILHSPAGDAHCLQFQNPKAVSLSLAHSRKRDIGYIINYTFHSLMVVSLDNKGYPVAVLYDFTNLLRVFDNMHFIHTGVKIFMNKDYARLSCFI